MVTQRWLEGWTHGYKRELRLASFHVPRSLDNQHSLPDFQTVILDTHSLLHLLYNILVNMRFTQAFVALVVSGLASAQLPDIPSCSVRLNILRVEQRKMTKLTPFTTGQLLH